MIAYEEAGVGVGWENACEEYYGVTVCKNMGLFVVSGVVMGFLGMTAVGRIREKGCVKWSKNRVAIGIVEDSKSCKERENYV